jgi:hypothetical protein
MKKIIILGLVLLMVVVFGTAALAKADVQKLVPFPLVGPMYPDASGQAIVNDSMGDVVLEITVSVKGLEPETEYEVKSCTSQTEADWTSIDFFTTNINGNGHFHINYREGDTLPPTGHIYINLGAGNTLLMDEDY